ncbi:MAG: hypothetical protein JXA20_15805 [Spirochaetes bacterium]|nr:hypothetical protein [Spirochaetota bacterium]
MGYFVAFILVGAIFGSALGSLAVRFAPSLSVLQLPLTGPIGVSLEIIDFHVRLNLSSLIGMALGVLIFWKV